MQLLSILCFSTPTPHGHRKSSSRATCRGLLSLIARLKRERQFLCRRRRLQPFEFSYDPLSYSLNFEDDRSTEESEALPFQLRDFSSRLTAAETDRSSSSF
ncbi:hypothetical protein MLD38_024818 [Melastoma candidum]|uniref:Uncharacterized protein n=1 Tax=Melastoma candidum TaxID=119954 RepID=A0ACB9NWI4_9MYRT|nr:hypothetical protein MLD38_024818 [Melastoma candidum]